MTVEEFVKNSPRDQLNMSKTADFYYMTDAPNEDDRPQVFHDPSSCVAVLGTLRLVQRYGLPHNVDDYFEDAT
jgi:hypothetical protein